MRSDYGTVSLIIYTEVREDCGFIVLKFNMQMVQSCIGKLYSFERVMKILLLLVLIAAVSSFSLRQEPSAFNPYNPKKSQNTAVYASLAFCGSQCLNNWSCKDAQKVPQLINVTYITKPLTQADGYIGYSPADDTIVVSFRGTDNIANWIENINFERAPYIHCVHCEIHAGWYTAYEDIAPALNARIEDLLRIYPTARLLATGHALGGAMAMIAGLELRRIYRLITEIHTFGAPRIGNLFLSNHIQDKIPDIYRVVHQRDVVPHLPTDVPLMNGYHHPAHEIFWNSDFSSYKVCDGNGEDKSCSNQFVPNFSVADSSTYFFKIGSPNC